MIRLFNGSSVFDGVVEYCLNSTWTPVCGDDWDESEAAVACRHLGLVGEGRTHHPCSQTPSQYFAIQKSGASDGKLVGGLATRLRKHRITIVPHVMVNHPFHRS